MWRSIIIVGLCVVMSAACTNTVYVPVETVKTVVTTVVDTVVDVRIEKEQVFVQTRDTVAEAETKYAKARAEYKAATLSLGLENKQTSIPVEVKKEIVTIHDSVPYPVEVLVEKEVRYTAWYDKAARVIAVCALLYGVCIVVRR